MDWISVLAAAGGAGAFAGAAKHVVDKLIDEAVVGRRELRVERQKLSAIRDAEHHSLVARTQLDVIGAVIDGIYPLKTALASRPRRKGQRTVRELTSLMPTIDFTIDALKATLGSRRPYIPVAFGRRVHSLKGSLLELKEFIDCAAQKRGRKAELMPVINETITYIQGDLEFMFAGMVAEAQRRIAGDQAATGLDS